MEKEIPPGKFTNKKMGKISPCFTSPDMENAFRHHTLDEDKKRARVVFFLTIFGMCSFLLLNLYSLKNSPVFQPLAVTRVAVVLLASFLFWYIPRVREKKQFDLILLGFCFFLGLANWYLTGFRAMGYASASTSDILIIFVIYLLVPAPLLYKAGVTLLITLASPSLWGAPSFVGMATLGTQHLISHACGIVFHIILNRSKRVQFAMLIEDRELKKTQAALLQSLDESERKYRYVVDNVGLSIVVIQDNRLVFVNEDAVDSTKRTRKEIFNDPNPYFHIFPEDIPRIKAAQDLLMAGDRDRVVEVVRTVSPDKDHRWLECSSIAISWDQKPATLNILKNVSRTKNLENELAFINERLNEQNKQLTQVATRDGLTGIHNRRTLYEYMEEQWGRAVRNGVDCSLIMLDIDHFKGVNDTHGHLAGDIVLKGVAGLVNSLIRDYDRFGRWGGEEFMLYLPDTDLAYAEGVAERIRTRVEETSFTVDQGLGLKITISLGVASRIQSNTMEMNEMIDQADKALYRAKEKGRNRVELA